MTIEKTLDERNREYAWSFREEVPNEMADFLVAFSEYNSDINPELPIRDFRLLDSAAVIVRFFGIPTNDAATDYVEMEVSIQSDNGRPLRFLDFLFRLHTLVGPYLEGADHEFYEGLTFVELRDGVPVLEVIQGS